MPCSSLPRQLWRFLVFYVSAGLLALTLGGCAGMAPVRLDSTPRIAVLSAFEPELVLLVAYSNGVPFIAFRSLSDLAGGGEAENEMTTFLNIAADNSAKVLLAFLAAWKP